MSKSNGYYCGLLGVGLITLLVFVITLPTYIIPYFDGQELDEIECLINNIDYPKTIPTHENYENWEDCDCGKYCKSYTPCINLYSSKVSTKKIIDVFIDPHKACTFHTDRCPSGEDIRNIQKYLNESYDTYNLYFNKTIPCYYDNKNDQIYLNKNTSVVSMAVSVGILGFLMLIMTIIGMCMCIDDCKEKRRNNINNREASNSATNTYFEA